MKILRCSALCLLASLLLLGAPSGSLRPGYSRPTQDAEEPRFLDGDLGKLEARVLSSKELLKDAPLHLIEVEVRNRGEFAVEPLAFEFVVPGTSRKDAGQTYFVRRVEEPWVGRAGRTVPVGGTLRYPLLAPVPKKLAKKTEVRVVSASFTEAEPLEEGFLGIGRPRVEKSFDAELGRTRKDTHVTLSNDSRREVEVVLLAKVEKPQDIETLVHVRLGPKEEREVVIDEYTGPWGNGTWEPEISKLELVDWSSIHEVDASQAIARFEEAYRSWHRWPETWPGLSGWFEMSVRDYQDHDCRGRFSIDRAGKVEIEPEFESSSSARGEAVGLIEDAFRDLMHPTFEEVQERSEFELIDEGPPQVLRMAKGPHLRNQGDTWVWAEEGRIRATLMGADRFGAREDWITAEFGEGWLIRGKDIYSSSTPPPMYEDRWAFDELAGQPVPTLYERRTVPVAARPESFSRIEFEALRPGVELEFSTEPPTGPLADTLREAWDAAYRYPSEPTTLRGEYSVKHPGTDLIWRGVLRVEGSFEMENFLGGRWSGDDFRANGSYRQETLDAVAAAARDRVQLYMGRDFSARPSFDRAFAGASLEEVRPGVIAVSDSRFLEITIEDGHIASYRFGDSTRSALRTFTLTRVKGQILPKRVQTGDEVLEYQFESIDGGWIVPKKVTMERVFGTDWGPEVMTLSKMSLSGD